MKILIGHCSYNPKSPCCHSLKETEQNVKNSQQIRQKLTWNMSTLYGKISLIDSLALDIILPCRIRISLDKFSSLTPVYTTRIAASLTGSGGQNTTFTCITHSGDTSFTHFTYGKNNWYKQAPYLHEKTTDKSTCTNLCT